MRLLQVGDKHINPYRITYVSPSDDVGEVASTYRINIALVDQLTVTVRYDSKEDRDADIQKIIEFFGSLPE